MSNWVRGEFCPGCSKMLYRLERDDDETEWKHSGAPMERDGLGHFVRCPHCKTRVSHRQSTQYPGFNFEASR